MEWFEYKWNIKEKTSSAIFEKQFRISYDMGYNRFAKIDLTDIFDVSNITKKFVSVLIIAKYPISSYNNKIL